MCSSGSSLAETEVIKIPQAATGWTEQNDSNFNEGKEEGEL